jgi:hypothetical protein
MELSGEVGLIVTAVAGGLATIIYAFKNIKRSSCCGCKCEQKVAREMIEMEVLEEEGTVIEIKEFSEI